MKLILLCLVLIYTVHCCGYFGTFGHTCRQQPTRERERTISNRRKESCQQPAAPVWKPSPVPAPAVVRPQYQPESLPASPPADTTFSSLEADFTSDSNAIFGNQNEIAQGSYNAIVGSCNYINGNANGVFGSRNQVNGNANLIGGRKNGLVCNKN